MGVSEGDVLAGKYVVEKLLGMGGMGAVVAAHHLQLDERVAIKFLLPEALKVPEAVARFGREARAATKIKSEHVVRIIDVGSFGSGEPYIVMEYLSGTDLGALVRTNGPLSVETAAEYLLQACEALAEAHALGIIHRDLKPANLFLTRRMDGSPLVKVLDFGISKITGTAGSGPDLGLTKTTAMMGSPLYMSPEQMSSARDVDARTDIWALGVILYELLAGTPPFDADTVPQLCAMVLQQQPEPLHQRRPGLPPEIEAVVSRCLEKRPEDRFSNVAELAIALGKLAPRHTRTSVKRIYRIVQSAGLSASALVLPASSDDVLQDAARELPAATAVSWSDTASESRKRSPLPLLIALSMVALFTVAGVGVLGRIVFARGPAADASSVAAGAASGGQPVATAPHQQSSEAVPAQPLLVAPTADAAAVAPPVEKPTKKVVTGSPAVRHGAPKVTSPKPTGVATTTALKPKPTSTGGAFDDRKGW